MIRSLFVFVFLISACSSIQRGPSSTTSEMLNQMTTVYEKELHLSVLNDEQMNIKKRLSGDWPLGFFTKPSLRKKHEENKQKIEALEKDIAAAKSFIENDIQIDEPTEINTVNKNQWRNQYEELNFTNFENYLIKDNKPSAVFLMSRTGTKDYVLRLSITQLSELKSTYKKQSQSTEQKVRFEFKCDGSYVLKSGPTKRSFVSGEIGYFEISSRKTKGFDFLPSRSLKSCEVTFVSNNSPDTKLGVSLKTEADVLPDLSDVEQLVDHCFIPDISTLSPLEKFFLTDKYSSMTCPNSVENISTLEDKSKALSEKIEALTGTSLPDSFFANPDPYFPLDFSKAPKLDAVYVSYLVFRNDVYGSLIAQALLYHAKQGTPVRILTTKMISLRKDKKLYEKLISQSGNIKVQLYQYDSQKGDSFREWLSQIHRSQHVKLLITYSAENPDHNNVFIGGRNIHDGFVFESAPKVSQYPEIVNYSGDKDESFAFWEDFEVRIRSSAFTKKLVGHFTTLWQQDSDTFFIRPINVNYRSSTPINVDYFNTPRMRHMISIPYKDLRALERFYVDMINSASESIDISSPYFRPTEKIEAALKAAVERGVSVRLITRLDLKGDVADFILGEVNKEGVNKFLNQIKMYEYTKPNVILHSKIVLIDGRVSFLGSVNLNKRSFVHDTENGLLIYDPDFTKQMSSIMSHYHLTTKEIDQKLKVAWWKKMLIKLLDTEF